MISDDEKFMLELSNRVEASLFRPTPNPKVGCLIVKDDVEIGFGIHRTPGGPHAEVIAGEIAGESIIGATVYVTLEPCSHVGKTAPCADYLISKKVAKVVYGTSDPTQAGGGAQKLKDAGIEVVSNIATQACERTIASWLHFQETNLPYVLLKFAKTKDGFIARADGSSKWISNEESRKLVHQLRAQSDAVLVGTKTAQVDLPKLDARIDGADKQPFAVVMGLTDVSLQMPHAKQLFTHEPREALSQMAALGIQSVLLEGGRELANAFLANGLVDEIWVFEGEATFGSGIPAPEISSANWKVQNQQRIGGDTLTVYVRI